MCECLWSDPQPMPGRAPSKRGIGVAFGPDVTRRFLADNKLDLVIRSHEVGLQRIARGAAQPVCTCACPHSSGLAALRGATQASLPAGQRIRQCAQQ